MYTKKLFSLTLVLMTLLLVMAGIPAQARSTGAQASSSGQGFTARSGVPISKPFLIADQSISTESPSVAYNSQQQEYLVVWWNDRPGNDDIYGQRVSKTGAPIGSWFAIAYGSGYDRMYPYVTYNSQQNEYLVTWREYDSSGIYSVQAQLVSGSGLLHGGLIDIAMGSSSFNYSPGAVSYDPTDDKYLVLYTEWDQSSHLARVLGQALNSGGSTWGSSFEVAPSLSAYGWFDLAYNSQRNEFLAVWDQTGSQADVMARRVKMTGGAGVLGSIITISTDMSNDDYFPRVAALLRSTDGQYLVAWNHCENNPNCNLSNILAQLISGEGNLEGATITFPNPFNMALEVDVAGCVGSSAYFATWEQTSSVAPGDILGDIAARFVSRVGGIEPDFWLDGSYSSEPSVACGPNGDYLVAYMTKSPTADYNIFGRLVGNRLYLPLVGK